MTTARIDPQLAVRLAAHSDTEFDLLVRVQQVQESVDHELMVLGVTIRRRLTLVPTYAVTCPGVTALELLRYPWVIQVEEDALVYTL